MKKSFNILLLVRWCFLLVLCSACSKKLPGETETIYALQQLQHLATVEYTVTKVVKANDNIEWYKPGERKILLTVQASVKAGIDLGELRRDDVRISGNMISVRLPEPKILLVNMPPENIKVAYSEVGFFRSNFSNAEKDALLAQAEAQVWKAGETTGILQQAKMNTGSFLDQFLIQLGFEGVTLTFQNDPPRFSPGVNR